MNCLLRLRYSCRLIFALFLIAAPLRALNFDLDAPLPPDPLIRVGQLENGLKYYVRENARPEGRGAFRLVVDAGSLQETDEQRGLAHFIEHMAFNGTEKYQKNELIGFLENLGMRFGRDLNASTSFNETVYELDAPTAEPEVVEQVLDVLHQWATAIAFDEREIDRERGVIVEEWRSRRTAQQRLNDLQYPFIFYKSQYEKRNPIGSMFVVRSASRERFVDFYNDWYRPDLMAVIAVGDFDGAEMEASIIEKFGGLEIPEGAPERTDFEIPDHEQPLFSIQLDPEITTATLRVLNKLDQQPDGSARDYRRHIVQRLFFDSMNNRLSERTLEAEPPYFAAGSTLSSLGREKQAFEISISLIDGRFQEGIDTVVAEVNRARIDGLAEGELARAKADYLRTIERFYEEREKTMSGVFSAEFTRAFLVDEPIPGIAVELEMTREFLKEISLEEVNAFAGSLPFENENRVYLYAAPDKEGVYQPTEEELMSAIEQAKEIKLESYDDSVSDKPLLAKEPSGGRILKQIKHDEVGAIEWRLSNGARVIAKATEFQNDQVLMTSFSPGGSSLVDDERFVSASTAIKVLGESGLGEFDIIDLEKKLAGTTVSISPYLQSQYEGVSGSFSPRDMEEFFKTMYLQFTQPRLDLQAFASIKDRAMSMVANRLKDPQSVFQDAISEAMYGDHPRHRPMSSELIAEIDPEQCLEIYNERFGDAGDFTFVFVGSFEPKNLKKFVRKYIASLPAAGREEKGKSVDGEPREGQLDVTIEKGLEERSMIRILFTGKSEWSPENAYAMQAMNGVLQMLLRDSLREELGGTYSVGVFGRLSRLPVESFSSGIGFTCDPQNVDLLIAASLAAVRYLQEKGPTAESLAKVKLNHLSSFEKGMKSNGYWMNALSAVAMEERAFSEILDYPSIIEGVTVDRVRQVAGEYFSFENVLVGKLHPEPLE